MVQKEDGKRKLKNRKKIYDNKIMMRSKWDIKKGKEKELKTIQKLEGFLIFVLFYMGVK